MAFFGKNIEDKKNWNKMKNKKFEKETKQKSWKLNNMKKLEKKIKKIKYIGKKWEDEKIGKKWE